MMKGEMSDHTVAQSGWRYYCDHTYARRCCGGVGQRRIVVAEVNGYDVTIAML